MISILMNPWILNRSEVQILKCIIVDLQILIRFKVCFASNRIPLSALVSTKFNYLVFP